MKNSTHLKFVLVFLILFHISGMVCSQDTGEKKYPYLGIAFSIPDGWIGQETESGYIMGSDTEAGFILLMTHESGNLEELKAEARLGIYEEGGTMLQLEEELESIGPGGIGGKFTGMLEYSQAKAYITAVINPFGKGVTVIAVTDPQHYSKRYEELAKEVAMSLKFATPEEPPVVQEWKEALKGAKLTYLSTSGESDYSGYSGSSSRTEILLCPDGSFLYFDSYSSSFDIDAGFGNTSSSDQGNGNWQVSGDGDGDGNATLELRFDDGRLFTFRLDYRDEKTYLNDSRYFRTYDHNQCY